MKKIISYNVNGIRAAMNKDLIGWLKEENPDVVCIQELKANVDQFPVEEFENLGYNCIWNSAEKKGYSGTALLSKTKAKNIKIGIDNEIFDSEGRVIRADFDKFSVISVYVPSGTTGDVRQEFKMDFLDKFYKYTNDLNKNLPGLVVSGDFNICHKAIDINHPEKHNGVSGFLPEEREWISKYLDSGFIDSFREFNNNPNEYSWWSYRAGARPKNLGWRIDYNMVSESLRGNLKNASILQSVVHSDHCPVVVELEV